MNLKDIPIIYTLETTGVAGGHKIVFEHINYLKERGYDVHLWALGPQPTWFDLKVPVGVYPHYPALTKALTEVGPSIKVATWWKTADPVAVSVQEGGGYGFYLVQDIETSYYDHMPGFKDINRVLMTYELDLHFLTTSDWVTKELRKHTKKDALISQIKLGLDLELFKPNKTLSQNQELVTIGRRNPLKDFPKAIRTIQLAMESLPDLHVSLFGVENMTVTGNANILHNPSNERVAQLYQNARCYLATSKHEGYNLPILEAMACGCPVVTTLADGNNHFCQDGVNCLVGETPEQLAQQIERVMTDDKVANTLRDNGFKTVKEHQWDNSIDKLIGAFEMALEGEN